MKPLHVSHQRLRVDYDFPVVFTRDALNPGNTAWRDAVDRLGEGRRHRIAVCVDAGLQAGVPGIVDRIVRYVDAHAGRMQLMDAPVVVAGGEAVKRGREVTDRVLAHLLERHLDRQSFVTVFGGGAVLDAVGLAAALAHRGVRLIRFPTTVVSQNDAGVGVKNGVNAGTGKNAIGTFAPPFAVINDLDFLDALPDREWIGGAAEAFKVAMIKDAEFFRYLCTHAAAYRARDRGVAEKLVIRCADLHLHHIGAGGDPFEFGRARPLDFGHWSAHQLERLSDFRVSHGMAVAAGIALDSLYAVRKGWLDGAVFEDLYRGLRDAGFALWHDELDLADGDGPAVFKGLELFREHLGGELCITFPDGLGRRREEHEVDLDLMRECLADLRRRAGGCVS